MRILMLAQFYPPIIGGEERHVRNLAAALTKRGHDVTVATLANKDAPPVETDQGVRIVRLRGTVQRGDALYSDGERRHAPPFPDPELMMGLRRIISEQPPDIVHAHNWLLHSFLPLKAWSGARFVVTLHDFSLVCAKKSAMQDDVPCSGPATMKCLSCAREHYGTLKGTVTTVSNWVSAAFERRLVDKFLTVSRAVAEGNALKAAGVPFEVVPNFVPDDISVLNDPNDTYVRQLPAEPFMLFVGDVRRLKGADALVAAYRRLKSPPPLVMIGRRCPDTPENLPPGVHLFNSWPHSAIMNAWKRCAFGLAPSIWPEPCATVVMEAMGMGKPMIATNIGGMPDLIDDGVTGLLVTPGDDVDLAAAMQRLIDDGNLRAAMSRASLEAVENLQAKTVVPRIEKIYLDLISGRNDRATRASDREAALLSPTYHRSGGP